jgi:hypothetical protein
VKLLDGIGERACDLGRRLAAQTLSLDWPCTSGRIPQGASKVPDGLGVVVGALPTGSVTSGNR